MRTLQYNDDEDVEVFDVGKKRWYKAVTTFCVVWDADTGAEGWECHLKNGNLGNFDVEHMRRPRT